MKFWENSQQVSGANRFMEVRPRWPSQILDVVRDGVVVIDLDGRIVFQNAEAKRIIDKRKLSISDFIDDLLVSASFLKETSAEAAAVQGNVVPLHRHRKPVSIRLDTFRSEHRELELSAAPLMNEGSEMEGIALTIREVEPRPQIIDKLLYQATHDELTGLANRRVFMDRLYRLASEPNGSENVLFLMDLDKFKAVNDRCGHKAGDEVLKQVVQVLRSLVRQRDTLARLGGDEFGLIMEHCTLNKAKEAAKQMCAAISKHVFQWKGEYFPLGLSLGIVSIVPGGGNVESLLAAADGACYHSKASGGSCATLCRKTVVGKPRHSS